VFSIGIRYNKVRDGSEINGQWNAHTDVFVEKDGVGLFDHSLWGECFSEA
jgi:hypothetical protein